MGGKVIRPQEVILRATEASGAWRDEIAGIAARGEAHCGAEGGIGKQNGGTPCVREACRAACGSFFVP